jgi:hypothetical protein
MVSDQPYANRWPLPSVLTQAGFFGGTFVAAWLFQGYGLAAMLLLASLIPTYGISKLWRRGDLLGIISVYLATMLVANLDALPLVLGASRRSLSLVIIISCGTCALCRLNQIKDEYILPLILLAGMLAIRVLRATDNADVFQTTLQNQLAYFITLLLFASLVPWKATRDAWIEKVCVCLAAHAGQCVFEMFFPASGLSISSSATEGVVRRAAGLFLNATNGGLVPVTILMLVALACDSTGVSRRFKMRLACILALGGVAIAMTFSRHAMILYLIPLFVGTWDLSGQDLRKTLFCYPLFGALAAGLALALIVVLEHTPYGLSFDARDRYMHMRNLITAGQTATDDYTPQSASNRLDNLHDSQSLWSNPTLFGLGTEFVAEYFHSGRELPHNQILFLLIEDGYVGALVFLAAMIAVSGLHWLVDPALIGRVGGGVIVLWGIQMGTFNLLDYRFFVLSIVTVMWTSRAASIDRRNRANEGAWGLDVGDEVPSGRLSAWARTSP